MLTNGAQHRHNHAVPLLPHPLHYPPKLQTQLIIRYVRPQSLHYEPPLLVLVDLHLPKMPVRQHLDEPQLTTKRLITISHFK